MDVLLGKSLTQLTEAATAVGLPAYTGRQLAQWLYQKRVTCFDEMTNISLTGRRALADAYTIGREDPIRQVVSQDGTRKYLFAVGDEVVETVYIPDADRATLCVSTQLGCRMGCRFCMTGTIGFHGQLTAAQILNQILYFPDLTNVVYMGEGEPMDNIDHVLQSLQVLTAEWGLAWSAKRITVSSVGLIDGLKRFLDESDCHLAISLHNPFPSERQVIMPAERRYSITQVLQLLHQYDWHHQRRVSFEYICWAGINDTPKHAQALLRLIGGLDCRVNLIRFHEGVDRDFPASNEETMLWLRDYLTAHGLTTTIRQSRGQDILAACGMLVNALNQETHP